MTAPVARVQPECRQAPFQGASCRFPGLGPGTRERGAQFLRIRPSGAAPGVVRPLGVAAWARRADVNARGQRCLEPGTLPSARKSSRTATTFDSFFLGERISTKRSRSGAFVTLRCRALHGPGERSRMSLGCAREPRAVAGQPDSSRRRFRTEVASAVSHFKSVRNETILGGSGMRHPRSPGGRRPRVDSRLVRSFPGGRT